MTEENFLKKLKSTDNNEQLHELLITFLDSNDKNMGIKIINKVESLLGKKKVKKTPEQTIEENFVQILQKFDYYYFINTVLPSIIKRRNLQPFLTECFPIFLENVKFCLDKQGSSFAESGFKIRNLVYTYIQNVDDLVKFEENNVEIILKIVPIEELLSVVKMLKGKSEKVDSILNAVMEEKKEQIVHYIITKAFQNKRSEYVMKEGFTEQIENDYGITVLKLLEDLMKSEEKTWIDLEEIGGASFSQVFEIGDKIFKIGIPRRTYKIPYHKRLLKPLIRTNLYDEKEENIVACVEISEKVKMLNDDLDPEVLYTIWKELRDEGIMWADPHPGNIGMLLKDNIPILNGEQVEVDDTAIGFSSWKHVKQEVLKKGEFVIIDTDLLYDVKDEYIEMTSLAVLFEQHYQSEQHNDLINRSTRIKSRGLKGEELDFEELVDYDSKQLTKYKMLETESDTKGETR